MKIGQKCFCAVRDKHLFHISVNEALLIAAANSLVSENNPETIDSVRKSIKNRPFLRISENFRKVPKRKHRNQKKQKKTKIWPNIAVGRLVAKSLVFWFFGFLFFLSFFWFCWLLGLQSFVLCRKLVLNH